MVPFLSACGAAPQKPVIATVSTDPPATAVSASAKDSPPVDKPSEKAPTGVEDKKTAAPKTEIAPSDEPSVEERLQQVQAQTSQMLAGLSSTAGTTSVLSGGSGGGAGLAVMSPAVMGTPFPPAPKVKGPTTNVAVPPPVVKGGAISNATPLTLAMVPGFRRCANSVLSNNPGAFGQGASAVILAKIDATGAVTRAQTSSNNGIPAAAAACMSARVSATTFAAPTGGTASQIEITIHVQTSP